MMQQTTVPAIHPQVAARPIDDAELLLLADAGEVLVLNTAGAFVWQELESGASVGELTRALAAHYAVSEDRARADVTALLNELIEVGALEGEG
jgi:hypothetical protein